MKKITYIFLVLLLIIFFSMNVLAEDSSIADRVNELGSISGKVLPIDSNATVYVYYPSQSSVTLQIAGFATISDNGEYVIPVPVGAYNIIVVSKGYYTNRLVSQIEVKENQVTEIEDIILTKSINAGSISGFVNPIVDGAIVVIKKHGANEFDSFDIVVKDGSYEITDLEPSTYGLFVRFNTTQNFYGYKWAMIDIVANTSLSGINLTFTPRDSSYLFDRIMLRFHVEVSEEEKRNTIESYNSTLMSHYSYSSSYTVNIPSDKTVEEMVDLFKTNPNVKSAYPVGIAHTAGGIVTDENVFVEYDPEILEEFNNQTWVPVLVRLVDNSNITVTGSKDERRALSRQIYEWFKPVREEVLAALSEAEFNLSGRRFNGFSGTITREGFDKLLNNTAVREIIWSNMPPPQLATNESISVSENVTEENITNETQIKEEPIEKEPEKQNIFKRIINWIINLFR